MSLGLESSEYASLVCCTGIRQLEFIKIKPAVLV